jgi:hypothetical protein
MDPDCASAVFLQDLLRKLLALGVMNSNPQDESACSHERLEPAAPLTFQEMGDRRRCGAAS